MKSVVVIGAGIIGVTASIELSTRGWDVTLLDFLPVADDFMNTHSSTYDTNKVVRGDYGKQRFYTDLMTLAFDAWTKWNIEFGVQLFHPTGVLVNSDSEMAPGSFQGESLETVRAAGYRVERHSPQTFKQRYPAWNANTIVDGYKNESGGWADSGETLRVLLIKAQKHGVRLKAGQAESVLYDAAAGSTTGKRVCGILLKSGEKLATERVIVAAGAWLPSLLPHLVDHIVPSAVTVCHFKPLAEDRHLYTGDRFPAFLCDIRQDQDGLYGMPLHPRTNTVKLGNHTKGISLRGVRPSAQLLDAIHELVHEREAQSFRDLTRRSLPHLSKCAIERMRVCMYAESFDGDFLIDFDPHADGLFVAGAGSGHAFKFAPVMGWLVADAFERKTNSWSQHFSWRNPPVSSKPVPPTDPVVVAALAKIGQAAVPRAAL